MGLDMRRLRHTSGHLCLKAEPPASHAHPMIFSDRPMVAKLETPPPHRRRLAGRVRPLHEKPAHSIRSDFTGQAPEAQRPASTLPGRDARLVSYPGGSIEACPAGRPKQPGPVCAFTIDVEDWYQSSVDFDAPITERVVRNCEILLEHLDQCGVKATFFVQGLVARAFPGLVRSFLQQGHEVESHGYSHRPLYKMNRAELRRELDYSLKTVEDAAGVSVTMFRAQDFSIRADNIWALELVAEAGFKIDSSVFAMRTKRYGIAGWPAGPARVRLPNGAVLLEAPVAVANYGTMRLPVAGGGYFRLIPQSLLLRALSSVTAAGRPAIVYCHPYEFAPDELDQFKGEVSPLFLHYQRLGRRQFAPRVRHLFGALPFGRMDSVLANWGVI
jgi:polysaccharide deacetylase family protein (PEP-CTERM system associated)